MRSGRRASSAGSGGASAPSAIGSPPVQPSSSITSGTGSVRTMWLDATAWARRKPGNPTVALFTASTAARARTRPPVCGRDRVRRVEPARPASRSWRRTPASSTFARSPSESRAGCTVADVRRIAPPRKPTSQRCPQLVRADGAHLLWPRRAPRTPRWRRRPRRAVPRSSRRRASAPRGTTRRRPPRRTTRRSRARRARTPARRRAPARRRLGRGGSAGRPTASRRSRRSGRSARARRAPPRGRRRRSPVRAPSAATPSRGRGTRRRR